MELHGNTTKSSKGHTLAKSAGVTLPITTNARKAQDAKGGKTPKEKTVTRLAKELKAKIEGQTPQPVVEAPAADAAPKVRRSKVPAKYKEKYAKNNGGCGDDMHRELTAATTAPNADGRLTLDWPALQAIAKQNGIDAAKYEGYNNGMKRMNIGNKLRGLLGAGTDVTIGTRVFKAEEAKAAGDK